MEKKVSGPSAVKKYTVLSTICTVGLYRLGCMNGAMYFVTLRNPLCSLEIS